MTAPSQKGGPTPIKGSTVSPMEKPSNLLFLKQKCEEPSTPTTPTSPGFLDSSGSSTMLLCPKGVARDPVGKADHGGASLYNTNYDSLMTPPITEDGDYVTINCNKNTNTISYDNPPNPPYSYSAKNHQSQEEQDRRTNPLTKDTNINTISNDNPRVTAPEQQSSSPLRRLRKKGTSGKSQKKISQVGIVDNEVEPDVSSPRRLSNNSNVCLIIVYI